MSFGKQNPSKSEGATVEINSDGNSSSSDSNTFYEEDFSSSENSSNEGEQVYYHFNGKFERNIKFL